MNIIHLWIGQCKRCIAIFTSTANPVHCKHVFVSVTNCHVLLPPNCQECPCVHRERVQWHQPCRPFTHLPALLRLSSSQQWLPYPQACSLWARKVVIFIKMHPTMSHPHRARFMKPIWGPPGADRTQVSPMLPPWTLLSGTHFCSWVISVHYNEPSAIQGPVLLQRSDTVAILSANGSVAFKETALPLAKILAIASCHSSHTAPWVRDWMTHYENTRITKDISITIA